MRGSAKVVKWYHFEGELFYKRGWHENQNDGTRDILSSMSIKEYLVPGIILEEYHISYQVLFSHYRN